jgi:hypothetical protein
MGGARQLTLFGESLPAGPEPGVPGVGRAALEPSLLVSPEAVTGALGVCRAWGVAQVMVPETLYDFLLFAVHLPPADFARVMAAGERLPVQAQVVRAWLHRGLGRSDAAAREAAFRRVAAAAESLLRHLEGGLRVRLLRGIAGDGADLAGQLASELRAGGGVGIHFSRKFAEQLRRLGAVVVDVPARVALGGEGHRLRRALAIPRVPSLSALRPGVIPSLASASGKPSAWGRWEEALWSGPAAATDGPRPSARAGAAGAVCVLVKL